MGRRSAGAVTVRPDCETVSHHSGSYLDLGPDWDHDEHDHRAHRNRFLALLLTVLIALGAATAVTYFPGSPIAGLRPDRLLATMRGGHQSDPSDTPPAGGEAEGEEPEGSESPGPPGEAGQGAASGGSSGPLLQAAKVTVNASGYWSWALLDTKSGKITGSDNPTATSDTASLIKSWIAADYLRRAAVKKQQPSSTVMSQLSTMIRDSDNTNASTFHTANGDLSSIKRMVSTCKMTDTKGTQNSWSLTQMSTRDIARLAVCIADGRAAGPKWTSWLLTEMRSVRGEGRFGVIRALPSDAAGTTAIKNGWLLRDSDHLWHISCMAIGDGWALGVHARYQGSLGKGYGEKTCQSVGEQLMRR